MVKDTLRYGREKHFLGRDEWLRAARLALLRGGVEAVRVAQLARDLGVTKGSFYWHFKDRDELLEMLLAEWERELGELLTQPRNETEGGGDGDGVAALMAQLIEQARRSEKGEAPSDAAIFAWASVSPAVAERVNRAEEERLALLGRLFSDPARVEILYLAWIGFVARGQRLPAFRRRFPEIARTMFELLAAPPAPRGA
jgi:AcrR family transcriptional regulator